MIIIIGQIIVYMADMFAPLANIAAQLSLIWPGVMQGQVWRLITFIFVPTSSSNPIFFFLTLYFYWFIGSTLQNAWGDFRFNLYYLCGVIGTIIAAVITGYTTATYLNMSLFFAYAMLYPNQQVLLFFIIPVKMKYLAWLNAGFFALTFITGNIAIKLAIVFSLINFLLFFGPDTIKSAKREIQYAKTRNLWRKNNRR